MTTVVVPTRRMLTAAGTRAISLTETSKISRMRVTMHQRYTTRLGWAAVVVQTRRVMTAADTRAISLTETSKISAHGARNAWSAEGPRTGVATRADAAGDEAAADLEMRTISFLTWPYQLHMTYV